MPHTCIYKALLVGEGTGEVSVYQIKNIPTPSQQRLQTQEEEKEGQPRETDSAEKQKVGKEFMMKRRNLDCFHCVINLSSPGKFTI